MALKAWPSTVRKSVQAETVWIGLALLLSVLAAAPIWGPGLVNTRAGGDSPFLLQRVHQLSQNLRAGVFPARWMPDGALGLGYPFFDFYAAFPYYLASALNLAGWGVLGSIKVTQTLSFLLAGAAMYALARDLRASPALALLSSAAYTFAPFHLVNVYVRGDALSEFYAYALYPVILYALRSLCARPSPARGAFLAGSLALLILTHNISALIYSPFLGLVLLVELASRPAQERRSILLAGSAALALGLLLSAWFWAPALREQGLVQLQDQTTGYFHFAGHFRGRDLLQIRLLHDYTIAYEQNPFAMGLAQAILAVGALALLGIRLAHRRPLQPVQLATLLGLALYTWLMTPASRWIWEHVPLLPYVQFPWRLLSMQALCLSLALALPSDGRQRGLADAIALLATLALAVAGLGGLRIDRLPLGEADISAERLMLYESFSGNIGTTIRHEYLPRTMTPRPYASARQLGEGQPAPFALTGELRSAEPIRITPARQEWQIAVAEAALLAFHTTFYPGWEARVDGIPQGVEPLPGLGLIGLRLSPGAHEVVLTFGRTPVRRYAAWLSAGACLLFLGLAWRGIGALRRRGRALAFIAALSLVVLAAGALWNRVEARQGDLLGPLIMDTARAPYLHHEPDGLFFEGAHLRDYTLSATSLEPGQRLELWTHWDEAYADRTVTVELLSVNAPLFESSPTWAAQLAPLSERDVRLGIDLPADLPPGMYVLRLSVLHDGNPCAATTPGGQGLGMLALQPIRVGGFRRAAGSETILGSYGPEREPPMISLVSVSARPLHQGLLQVELTWRSERQAALNYVMSARLRAPDGRVLVARDLPPLLGGYPTTLWRPGELVSDRVLMPYPTDTPSDDRYSLEIVLYDRLTLQAIGASSISGIALR